MTAECDCASYDDLPLDLSAIEIRVALYNDMRPKYRQLSQRVYDRWIEHYRLYKCDVCDQYWQSSLSPGWGDTWYLFKVPKISPKVWKQKPYVAPDSILSYLEAKKKYMANNFETRKEKCVVESCESKAISGLLVCMYHQFLQIGGKNSLEALESLQWFLPYDIKVLDR